MPEPAPTDLVKPADDVYAWVENESSVMLKAVTRFGDPVELTMCEAHAIGVSLISLAEQLNPRPPSTTQ
jgi:hypothetical protein